MLKIMEVFMDVKKNKKIYENFKKILKQDILEQKTGKIKCTTQRGHELHIRIENLSEKAFYDILYKHNLKIDSCILDNRYSGSYLTNFITFEGINIPVILSIGRFKISGDSFISKQLTPFKLGIIGNYNNIEILLEDIKQSLLKSNISLNDYWIKQGYTIHDIINLLIKLSIQAAGKNFEPYTKNEIILLNGHSKSIGKDFGEILTAIDILVLHKNVNFPNSSSEHNYDISYKNRFGANFKINCKSGKGSGQSFNSIEKELSIINDNDYLSGSISDIFINLVKILNNKTFSGKHKTWEAFEYLYNNYPEHTILRSILNDISSVFFDNKNILLSNYNNPKSFNDFHDKAMTILDKYSLKKRGIPRGRDKYERDLSYEKKDGAERAITFFISTLIASNFDNEAVDSLMNQFVRTKIDICHIYFNDNGVNFYFPKEITYNLHYWGNFKEPLNNLMGFKSLYILE